MGSPPLYPYYRRHIVPRHCFFCWTWRTGWRMPERVGAVAWLRSEFIRQSGRDFVVFSPCRFTNAPCRLASRWMRSPRLVLVEESTVLGFVNTSNADSRSLLQYILVALLSD